jgi:hypothetical protein
MTQVCTAGTTKFRLDPTTEAITSTDTTNDVCIAANLLDRLHREFTEQYSGSTTDTIKHHPTFHLRNQPTTLILPGDATAPTNRYYSITTTAPRVDASYNGMMNAIMKGTYETNSTDFNTPPVKQTNFDTPEAFKGLHGLQNLNELLQEKIAETVNAIPPMVTTASTSLNSSEDYEKRRGIKMTIEEIAHRENQLYREKFLNIILILVGLFLVSTQLVSKYFSFGGGGGGGGGGFGFGGISGWLSTRFGTGSGGIFSRFGGLGLGSSGRSRVGNLFTSNPYSLSRR